KNYPIRTEPGKGRYALYFSLNERAVIFNPQESFLETNRQRSNSFFEDLCFRISIVIANIIKKNFNFAVGRTTICIPRFYQIIT
ncbi:MAG: hypothetical protein K2M01_01585, partial [Paramuribaculum sp.]|nr:hypothetical protein [Paramuribaculum sp.]